MRLFQSEVPNSVPAFIEAQEIKSVLMEPKVETLFEKYFSRTSDRSSSGRGCLTIYKSSREINI